MPTSSQTFTKPNTESQPLSAVKAQLAIVAKPRVAVKIRNTWFTEVVARNTPTKKVYRFAPGETKNDVDPLDQNYLLSLVRPGGGCCGSSSEPRSYFILEE